MKKNYRRGDIGRFLATRTKKLTETTNLVETKISELTKEEMQLCSCGFPQSFPIPHEHDRTEREKQIIDHYEILIENMDKKVKVSRDAWNKWMGRIKDDYNLGPMHIIYLVKEMFTELGLEVEEKEA